MNNKPHNCQLIVRLSGQNAGFRIGHVGVTLVDEHGDTANYDYTGAGSSLIKGSFRRAAGAIPPLLTMATYAIAGALIGSQVDSTLGSSPLATMFLTFLGNLYGAALQPNIGWVVKNHSSSDDGKKFTLPITKYQHEKLVKFYENDSGYGFYNFVGGSCVHHTVQALKAIGLNLPRHLFYSPAKFEKNLLAFGPRI